MLGGLSMSGMPINAQPYAGGHRFINSPTFTNQDDFSRWLAETQATNAMGGLLNAGQNYINPMGQSPNMSGGSMDNWGVPTSGGMVPGLMGGQTGGLMDADYSGQLGENWVEKLMTPAHQEPVSDWYNSVQDYGQPPSEDTYNKPGSYTPPQTVAPAPVAQNTGYGGGMQTWAMPSGNFEGDGYSYNYMQMPEGTAPANYKPNRAEEGLGDGGLVANMNTMTVPEWQLQQFRDNPNNNYLKKKPEYVAAVMQGLI